MHTSLVYLVASQDFTRESLEAVMKASACKVSGDMQCAASGQRDTDIPFPVACCWGRLQRKGSWQKRTTRQGSASDPSHGLPRVIRRHGFAVLACVTKEQPDARSEGSLQTQGHEAWFSDLRTSQVLGEVDG